MLKWGMPLWLIAGRSRVLMAFQLGWLLTKGIGLLLRDIEHSVVSTIVLSYAIEEGSATGLYLTYVPESTAGTKCREVETGLTTTLAQLQNLANDIHHPLLLPTLFLERKLKEMEQSCVNGISPSTYRALSKHVDSINHPRDKTFSEIQDDIQTTAEGVYNRHQQLATRRTRIAELTAMLSAICRGSELLEGLKRDSHHDYTAEYINSAEDIKNRLDFLKERLRSVESQTETSKSEFQNLDTMVGTLELPPLFCEIADIHSYSCIMQLTDKTIDLIIRYHWIPSSLLQLHSETVLP